MVRDTQDAAAIAGYAATAVTATEALPPFRGRPTDHQPRGLEQPSRNEGRLSTPPRANQLMNTPCNNWPEHEKHLAVRPT